MTYCTDTWYNVSSVLNVFPRYWPFVRGIHRSPVNSPHKGQWRGALMFSLMCVWINGCVNNREAGDLRRNQAHYDVIVMIVPDTWYYLSSVFTVTCSSDTTNINGNGLTHWGPVTHICLDTNTNIGSHNGLSSGQRQAIIWTNAGILLIRPLSNKFQWAFNRHSNIFIQENAFESVVCEMAAILSRPQCVNAFITQITCKLAGIMKITECAYACGRLSLQLIA